MTSDASRMQALPRRMPSGTDGSSLRELEAVRTATEERSALSAS